MYLSAPLHSAIFYKSSRVMKMCHFWAKNDHLSWTKIFWYKPLLLLHLPIGPFRCAKFKKITVDPELWGCAILGPKMVNLPPIFFWKIINIILIYLLALFIVQNLKKLLQWIQSYEDAHFLGPKLPISANENFSRKAITEPCFMPIYMPKIKVRY